jgi:hypothetical protein
VQYSMHVKNSIVCGILVMPRKIMSNKDRLSKALRLARNAAPDGVLRAKRGLPFFGRFWLAI